ncbi:MAG: hypothetical protein KDK78_12310, partial [Chlamydiia bacterium]|nr:hypothetical protein [Chlamydiia bacterium]
MTQTSFHQRLYWADRANGLLTDMADHFKRLEAMEKEVSAIHEKVNGVCLEALDAEAFNEQIQLTGGCFRISKGIDDYQDKVIVVAKKICDLVRAAYNMPYTDVKAIKSVTEGYEAHKQVATVLFDRLRVSTNDLVKQYAAAQCQHLRRKLGQGSDGDAMTEVQAIMSQLSICV